MNIKVAALTVSEKSINIDISTYYGQRCHCDLQNFDYKQFENVIFRIIKSILKLVQ